MRKPQFIAEQGRKPSGLLGQIVARVMAKETADENDFALKLLQLQSIFGKLRSIISPKLAAC